jgi:hypothetical protein
MNYLIVDTTTNTDAIYIGCDDGNCFLEENAMVFHSKEEAEIRIEHNGWGAWASTLPTNYPVNQ